MKRKHEQYKRMQATLRLNFRDSSHMIDNKYIMIEGIPIGELGWRWWINKVIDALAWKKYNKFKAEREYEELRKKAGKRKVTK